MPGGEQWRLLSAEWRAGTRRAIFPATQSEAAKFIWRKNAEQALFRGTR
jgi:hypothetical protein